MEENSIGNGTNVLTDTILLDVYDAKIHLVLFEMKCIYTARPELCYSVWPPFNKAGLLSLSITLSQQMQRLT